MSKAFPSIPDPLPNIESLFDVVNALKQSVELLAGQRGSVAPNRVFVQSTTPTAERAGDIWVNTGNNSKIYCWDGKVWTTVTT